MAARGIASPVLIGRDELLALADRRFAEPCDPLSACEYALAALVASPLTNRDIAARTGA
jgi:hypothetical protein